MSDLATAAPLATPPITPVTPAPASAAAPIVQSAATPSVPNTGAVARIRQALIDGKKVEGHRGPKHNRKIKGVLNHHLQHIELAAADILEVIQLAPTKTHTMQELEMGCLQVKPDATVTIYADHAFHLVNQAC